MCGIVGALGPHPIDPDAVTAMRDDLAHRGPDSAGLWLAADRLVCLGHRRLAIVDLSPEANQPFVSGDGRFVLVFNGEIYNFVSLRTELEDLGVAFRSRSDTEVLLEAYRQWGSACLARLAGMFAFAIWDRVDRRLFCARDRVGEKPFYYTTCGGTFLFGSELKALVHWPGFARRIDYEALTDYLTFGFVADPKAIWQGCYKLPPGHSLTVRTDHDGSIIMADPVAYWDMQFEPDERRIDWEECIRETLKTASREMSIADVPVGAFLSGGVDSSSVTAALCKAGCSVRSFTVGFAEPEYDERTWAQTVANLYGTVHTDQVLCSDDIAPVFGDMVRQYDEPFNDYSSLPTFCLCRTARAHITVALSGDGGDELFAGYRKYQRLALRQRLQRLSPDAFTATLAAGAATLAAPLRSWQRTLAPYATDATTMLTDMLTTAFTHHALTQAARGPLAASLRHYAPADLVAHHLRQAPPREVGLINAMRYLDLKLTLAGDILVKVDRASMAVSLEVRPVYLHREMLALAQRIPPTILATRAESKKLLKSALRPWLPDSILRRQKRGFALPLRSWIDAGHNPLTPAASGGDLADILDAEGLLHTAAETSTNGRTPAACTHSVTLLAQWRSCWT